MIPRNQQRKTRHRRIRAKVAGTGERPRLAVFRSNKHLYIQLVNDDTGKTVASVSDTALKNLKGVERARELGKLIGAKAKEQNITKAVFDRAGYRYHGNVKAVAEGARETGLSL